MLVLSRRRAPEQSTCSPSPKDQKRRGQPAPLSLKGERRSQQTVQASLRRISTRRERWRHQQKDLLSRTMLTKMHTKTREVLSTVT